MRECFLLSGWWMYELYLWNFVEEVLEFEVPQRFLFSFFVLAIYKISL
jgi:hypothetical protein